MSDSIEVGDLVVGQASIGGNWLIGRVLERNKAQYAHETSISPQGSDIQRYILTDTVTVLEKAPFEPIPEGRWVKTDGRNFPQVTKGRVHSYSDDKRYYEIIVTIPREDVEEDYL
jgi:hypothetical protein